MGLIVTDESDTPLLDALSELYRGQCIDSILPLPDCNLKDVISDLWRCLNENDGRAPEGWDIDRLANDGQPMPTIEMHDGTTYSMADTLCTTELIAWIAEQALEKLSQREKKELTQDVLRRILREEVTAPVVESQEDTLHTALRLPKQDTTRSRDDELRMAYKVQEKITPKEDGKPEVSQAKVLQALVRSGIESVKAGKRPKWMSSRMCKDIQKTRTPTEDAITRWADSLRKALGGRKEQRT